MDSIARWRSATFRDLINAIVAMPSRIQIAGGVAIIAVLVVTSYLLLLPQAAHVVSLPASMNGYVRQSERANGTAQQFKSQILAGAGGAVSNVVAATYEKSVSSSVGTGPQIIVFIGGNLSSGSNFIGGITQLRGSFTTNAGPLGGQAACVPGSNGGPAECAWADGDTFGVLVSATLGATGLADEMRLMRPLAEHVAS